MTAEPKCRCGASCWTKDMPEEDNLGPCSGKILATEVYSGEYEHYCEGHGEMEDYYATKDSKYST